MHWEKHGEKLDGAAYPQDQCTWEPAGDTSGSQLDFGSLKRKQVEVSTCERKALGEFVECQPDSKRCKVTYDTAKADQWLP